MRLRAPNAGFSRIKLTTAKAGHNKAGQLNCICNNIVCYIKLQQFKPLSTVAIANNEIVE